MDDIGDSAHSQFRPELAVQWPIPRDDQGRARKARSDIGERIDQEWVGLGTHEASRGKPHESVIHSQAMPEGRASNRASPVRVDIDAARYHDDAVGADRTSPHELVRDRARYGRDGVHLRIRKAIRQIAPRPTLAGGAGAGDDGHIPKEWVGGARQQVRMHHLRMDDVRLDPAGKPHESPQAAGIGHAAAHSQRPDGDARVGKQRLAPIGRNHRHDRRFPAASLELDRQESHLLLGTAQVEGRDKE